MLLTDKLIDSSNKSRKAGVACKLDIKKDYDHVNWNFHIYVRREWVLVRDDASVMASPFLLL